MCNGLTVSEERPYLQHPANFLADMKKFIDA
jgi:hypothetical protein